MTQGNNLYRAFGQWASRPDDQRFLTLGDLKLRVSQRRQYSKEERSTNKAMSLMPIEVGKDKRESIAVETEIGLFEPTNWSFKQLVDISQGTDKGGVKWLKPGGVAKIHPRMAATAINYGLNFLASQSANKLLLDTQADEFRAVTTENYGRIWDDEVVDAVIAVNQDERWIPPVALDGSHSLRSTTLYASDRDVFIFLVDPNNPIEILNPTTGQIEVLYRGFFVWNSEVGKASFGLTTFLYRFICDNRIVWGAEHIRELRLRHTKFAPERFLDSGQKMLQDYANSSAKEEKARIEKAMELTLGNSEKDVKSFLRNQKFGAIESDRIIKTAEAEEGEARTLWQIIQGATAAARSIKHTDARIHMERRAGDLMRLAA